MDLLFPSDLDLPTADSNPNKPLSPSPSHSPNPTYLGTKQHNTSKWFSAYSNIQPECILPAPRGEITEWCIRTRSRNADGWSDYSNIKVINKYSHPSLFLTNGGFAVEGDMSPYMRNSNSRNGTGNGNGTRNNRSNQNQPEQNSNSNSNNRVDKRVNQDIRRVKKSMSSDGNDSKKSNLMSKSTPNLPPNIGIGGNGVSEGNSKVIVPIPTAVVAGTGARAVKGAKNNKNNSKSKSKPDSGNGSGTNPSDRDRDRSNRVAVNFVPGSAFSATQNNSNTNTNMNSNTNPNTNPNTTGRGYDNGPSTEELFIQRELES